MRRAAARTFAAGITISGYNNYAKDFNNRRNTAYQKRRILQENVACIDAEHYHHSKYARSLPLTLARKLSL